MKKVFFITTAVLAVLYIFAGCADSGTIVEETETSQAEPSDEVTQTPLFTIAPAEEPEETQQAEEQELYSSYAYMRSFDEKSGIAQFDYFDVYTGQEAVSYLINCEGYCSLVAQEEVANYEESSFLEVNPSGALWDIDLTETQIKLLYDTDGSILDSAEDVQYEDIVSLWNLDKSILLQNHFYYITVDEQTQQVMLVEQLSGFLH